MYCVSRIAYEELLARLENAEKELKKITSMMGKNIKSQEKSKEEKSIPKEIPKPIESTKKSIEELYPEVLNVSPESKVIYEKYRNDSNFQNMLYTSMNTLVQLNVPVINALEILIQNHLDE